MANLLTWAIQGEDSPAHVGRLLASVLMEEGVVNKGAGAFQVTEDTGANMQIRVGSGTAGDLCVIKGDLTAQGTYVAEHQDASTTLLLSASDATNDRIDLVIARVWDDDEDSGGRNLTDIEVVEGTPAAVPAVPALPGGAIPLAEVLVQASVTAITDGDITDRREEARLTRESRDDGPRGVIGYAQVTSNQTGITNEVDAAGLSVTVDVPAGRRLKLTAKASWSADSGTGLARLAIKEGSTFLQTLLACDVPSGAGATTTAGSVVIEPTEGEHTYKCTVARQTGSNVLTMIGTSSGPAFLLVEDIGPAD